MATTLTIEEALGCKELSKVFWWNYYEKEKYQYIINSGGTNSGKTYSVMQLLGLIASWEQDRTITVVGVTLPTLRIGAMRDWENIIKQSPFLGSQITNVNKHSNTWVFKSGSIIEFKSYETAMDARNGKRHYAFFNEINNIGKDIYTEVADRTSLKIFSDFNPSARFYIHDMYQGDPKATFIYSNFTHNPHTPARVIESLLKYKLTNANRWRVMGQGLLGRSEGNVYTDWEVVESFPEDCDRVAGFIDYGYRIDPTAVGRAGVYKGALYVECLIYSKQLKINSLGDRLVNIIDKYTGPLQFVADVSAPESNDTLKDTFFLDIQEVSKKKGSILDGIQLLQNIPIRVVKNPLSGYVIHELENYLYKRENGELTEIPIDKYNHFLDGLRYYGITYLNDTASSPYEDADVNILDIFNN